ncbi:MULTISPECIES: RNA repair transcriptional activator RtcR family protein [unclassified Sphingobium]|uniref:RNA repair transcriptional activator RtcR family protein n=1 Tax=unclassified Sphingobium TaxID=2611147 RepID=UPI0029CAC61A|nr:MULTISPECIES: RNA repair transcriptional activator RtcR family protein [unclassified Sphingobium]MCW2414627.1 hypothetical protein [Sphingobium sp. B8D3A]
MRGTRARPLRAVGRLSAGSDIRNGGVRNAKGLQVAIPAFEASYDIVDGWPVDRTAIQVAKRAQLVLRHSNGLRPGSCAESQGHGRLLHITTGAHVAQICLFLLTEARYLPGRLLQTSRAV